MASHCLKQTAHLTTTASIPVTIAEIDVDGLPGLTGDYSVGLKIRLTNQQAGLGTNSLIGLGHYQYRSSTIEDLQYALIKSVGGEVSVTITLVQGGAGILVQIDPSETDEMQHRIWIDFYALDD